MLEVVIWQFDDIFSLQFSSSRSKIKPLRADLTEDERQVGVTLSNQMLDQLASMRFPMQEVVQQYHVKSKPSNI